MFYGYPLALGSILLKNAVQLWETSLVAPQVVAGRSARFASRVGAIPTARDTSEMLRMGTEKSAALSESLAAVGVQAWRTNLQLLELGARQWWGALPAM